MSARDDVLMRIRRARHVMTAVSPEPLLRDYRRAGESAIAAENMMAVLIDRLVDYKAVVTEVSESSLGEAITEVLARHAVVRVVLPDGFPLDPSGWAVDIERDEPALSASYLDGIDAVVTTSAVAIAETGTIVLDAGPGMGRRALTLVPDLHIVVVRRSDVVLGVPEALTRLDPTRPLTWISGPSATSDIELSRVEGVHGPRRLEVVVVG